MTTDQQQIQMILDQAQRLGKTLPDWVYRVEQINQQQYERTKSLAACDLGTEEELRFHTGKETQ